MEAFHPSEEEPLAFLQVGHLLLKMGEALNRERMAIASIQGHDVFPYSDPDAANPIFSIADPTTWES